MKMRKNKDTVNLNWRNLMGAMVALFAMTVQADNWSDVQNRETLWPTLTWDTAQIEGTLLYYQIYVTDDLTLQVNHWDIYGHDDNGVTIDDFGKAEHTVTLTPLSLDNPLGDKGFFKVKAMTRDP